MSDAAIEKAKMRLVISRPAHRMRVPGFVVFSDIAAVGPIRAVDLPGRWPGALRTKAAQ